MYPTYPSRKKNDIDLFNLGINALILALTVEIVFLNRRNVMLNTRNVELNTQNVINNKASAKSGQELLETLKEINQKIK